MSIIENHGLGMLGDEGLLPWEPGSLGSDNIGLYQEGGCEALLVGIQIHTA